MLLNTWQLFLMIPSPLRKQIEGIILRTKNSKTKKWNMTKLIGKPVNPQHIKMRSNL